MELFKVYILNDLTALKSFEEGLRKNPEKTFYDLEGYKNKEINQWAIPESLKLLKPYFEGINATPVEINPEEYYQI